MAGGNTPRRASDPNAPGRILRVVLEALGRVAAPEARDEILRSALRATGDPAVPDDPLRLAAFVTGPLFQAVERRLGPEAAAAVQQDLFPIVERARTEVTSGVRAKRRRSLKPVVLVATLEREKVGAPPAGILTRVVDDLFSLLADIGEFLADDLIVVVDCRMPSARPGGLAALARVLPPRARVILWGPDAELEQTLKELQAAALWWRAEPDVPASDIIDVALATPQDEEEPPVAAQDSYTILVADDSESFRAAIVRVLRSQGFRVVSAPDGYSALTECLEHPPDLVISDYDMPIVNGQQLIVMLQEMMGEHAPPVIVLTGDDRARISIVGAAAILPKGASQEDIVEFVHRLIRRD